MEESSSTIQKPNNDGNKYPYNDLINDKYISSDNNWPHISTRVFDIYSAKDFSKDTPYLDVFAEEFHPKEPIKQEFIDENRDLLNIKPTYITPKSADGNATPLNRVSIEMSSKSNNDESIPMLVTDATLKNKVKKSTSIDNQSSTLNSIYQTDDTKNLDVSSANIMKCATSNSYTAKDTTDKWPSEVEDAFVASLKLIPKKGTSKIKVSHKNYGRNELISLYIYYYTRYFRSKKQISSHIQVLKKAVNSKKDNKLSISDSELELYDLIENGAPRTEKTRENFEKEFTVIVEELEKEVLRDPKHLLCESFPMLNPLAKKKNHLLNGKHDKHNRITTPDSARNNMSSAFKLEEAQELLRDKQVLMYPAKYARDMYENLPEYKCFPVSIEDDNVYYPYLTANHDTNYSNNNNNNNDEENTNVNSEECIVGKKLMSRDDALQEASKIEKKQGAIINMVYESLQVKPNIEENNTAMESDTSRSNNNLNNNRKNSIPQNTSSSSNNNDKINISYKNDVISADSNASAPGMLPNYSSYYSNSPLQWNTMVQPSTAPPNSQNNKVKASINDLSEQSQLLAQADSDLLQNQSQLYSMSQKNRLYPTFTPVDSNFPSNYPPLQWFSPNNQLTLSQYNIVPAQYTQNSDFVDYKSSNQSVTGQPQGNQQPYSQYQSPYLMSGGPPNTSPAYPTFNSQYINKPFH